MRRLARGDSGALVHEIASAKPSWKRFSHDNRTRIVPERRWREVSSSIDEREQLPLGGSNRARTAPTPPNRRSSRAHPPTRDRPIQVQEQRRSDAIRLTHRSPSAYEMPLRKKILADSHVHAFLHENVSTDRRC